MALKSRAMGVLDHGAVMMGCEKWEGEAQDRVWPSDSGLQGGGEVHFFILCLVCTRAPTQFSRGRLLVELNINIKGRSRLRTIF